MKLVFVLVLIPLVVFAKSGTKVGDGGNGVACPGLPVEFLDIYEAEHAYGYFIEGARFDWPGSSVESSPLAVNDQLAVINELALMKARAQSALPSGHPFLRAFERAADYQHTLLTAPAPLADVNGAGFVNALPSGCVIETIAALVPLRGLVVREDFWMKASSKVKAALLLHEALHPWFAGANAFEGTLALRQAVALLAAPDQTFNKKRDLFLDVVEHLTVHASSEMSVSK